MPTTAGKKRHPGAAAKLIKGLLAQGEEEQPKKKKIKRTSSTGRLQIYILIKNGRKRRYRGA